MLLGGVPTSLGSTQAYALPEHSVCAHHNSSLRAERLVYGPWAVRRKLLMLLAPFLRRWTYTRHHEQVRGRVLLPSLCPQGPCWLAAEPGWQYVERQCRSCWQTPVVRVKVPFICWSGCVICLRVPRLHSGQECSRSLTRSSQLRREQARACALTLRRAQTAGRASTCRRGMTRARPICASRA